MKQSFAALVAVIILAGTVSVSHAQFTSHNVYLGPEIALGRYGTGAAVGGFAEFPLTNPGTMGPGILALALRLDYWGYTNGDYTYSFIPISAMADYHFPLQASQFDPFAGLGLGYDVVNTTYAGTGISSPGYKSGLFLVGQIGARYFFSPGFAARAEVGFGDAFLGLGVDFKL